MYQFTVSYYRTWTDAWDDDLSSFRHMIKQVIGSVEMYFQPQQLMDMLKIDAEKTGPLLLFDKESPYEWRTCFCYCGRKNGQFSYS